MVANQKYLLTDYQKQIWDSMDNDKVLGISAPTSAGKSFVILLKLVDRLINDNIDIVYIVPTLSLLNQVTEDFNRELKKVGVTDYWISNSFDDQQLSNKKNIYIMTQEKAIAAFSDTEKAFTKRLILVADEIQNIERIREDKDQRAKILYDTLIEFRYKDNVEQIIISGPRIEEIEKVGKSIFGIETKDHTTDISPVLNLTYSIKKVDKKYYLKQYCALTQEPLTLEIENAEIIEGYGKKQYTDRYLSYLNNVVKGVGENCQNIVFSPTSDSARKIAMALGDTTEIVQIKKLLAEIWNIPYGITIYAKHNRKAFVQLRILELLLSDNIGHIELDECNKPALIKIDLTQSNSELKREFMIKWTHCISQVDGITRYLKYMNKKMMRYQRLITNVTDVKELKEIVENIKD